jgi:hypothetical protein
MLLAGCQRQQPAAAPAVNGRPPAIAAAELSKGRVICPLESVNGRSIREGRTFRAGRRATLVGWSRVADRRPPAPPMLFVVFRSVVTDGSQDLFWPGLRVARPDVSREPGMGTLGYSATGVFPVNPGRYQVLVWAGDRSRQRECDTGETFEIRE